MAKFLRDFPTGPLDYYRKLATFDWKKLKIFLDTEEIVEYEHNLHNELEANPLFHKELQTESLEKQRYAALKKMYALNEIEALKPEQVLINLRIPMYATSTCVIADADAYIKKSLTFGMCVNVIQTMGSRRHDDYVEKALSGEIIVCFCLTEIGHGSNVKGMKTTATYDEKTEEFVLHSPSFEAAKCWAGLLGQTATHAIIFAQLITQGVNHGLHAFIVPVRDTRTFTPFPGVIAGDMGEKISLNGLDNGFVLFNNYRIPRENLLNRTGDVEKDGTYKTPYKDPNKRHGASLGALSFGRVNITTMCNAYLTKAVTIAVRYAAVRKQFGSNDDEEIPILEYQSHQHRLIPYLASCYILRVFNIFIMQTQYQFAIDALTGQSKADAADLGLEMHAISSSCKPVAGWLARDGIQECREACAGHGYLKVAGLGDARNQHDPNLTYEGENHVLIQQTSNWLLKYWPLILKGEKFSTPLNSIGFLNNAQQILKNGRFRASNFNEVTSPDEIFSAYQWLTCYLLKKSYEKETELIEKRRVDAFEARNEIQVYHAKTLAIVYIQHFFLQKFIEVVQEAPNPEIKNVLLKLFSLYGLWTLEKFLGLLYQGGYASGEKPAALVQEAILSLCKEVKNDAVALVDTIAPPDFLLNSVLGASDGEVYKRLQSAIYQTPGALSRPKWWKEIVRQSKAKL